jgi:hypothetical protein
MPQRPIKQESTMRVVIWTLVVLLWSVANFGSGYYVASRGYKVTDAEGTALVKSNAAQTVKEENAKLGRDVIGKTEQEAKQLLAGYNRTMFVGMRDGELQTYVGQKTFTNLTVEVLNGKVVKIMGWY